MLYINSILYIVFLFVGTGLFILLVDVKGYVKKKMKKEKKIARFLGWLNVSLGGLIFVGNWVYHQWFW